MRFCVCVIVCFPSFLTSVVLQYSCLRINSTGCITRTLVNLILLANKNNVYIEYVKNKASEKSKNKMVNYK